MSVERYEGRPVDEDAFQRRVREAVREVVGRQVSTGIDLVSDGEFGKFSYQTYIAERVNGIGGVSSPRPPNQDALDFPEWAARNPAGWGTMPRCRGPLSIKDERPLERELRNFREAVAHAHPAGTFLTAASPGLTASFIENTYYPNHAAYLAALTEVMRPEYEAIVAAGFNLQLDCPDLASARKTIYAHLSDAEFLRLQELAVDAINAATAAIPPERMRMHICWGNYEGPHHRDIPLERVFPTAVKARPAAILFEGANPRHEHEWAFFRAFRLPDDKVIVPGMIDTTTNFIEHPELVAQRIERYAELVGRERVIAGVDCGFATGVTHGMVDPEIMWAKFATLVEGARIASDRLWTA